MHMKGLYIILITSKFVQVLTRVLRLSLNVEQSNFSSLSEIYICYSLYHLNLLIRCLILLLILYIKMPLESTMIW